jgi:hypothetical protein
MNEYGVQCVDTWIAWPDLPTVSRGNQGVSQSNLPRRGSEYRVSLCGTYGGLNLPFDFRPDYLACSSSTPPRLAPR